MGIAGIIGLVAGAFFAGGGGGLLTGLFGGGKEQGPSAPPPLPERASDADASRAGVQQRQRAAASEGRGSTIQTGPGGLGELGDKNKETKSLLGY